MGHYEVTEGNLLFLFCQVLSVTCFKLIDMVAAVAGYLNGHLRQMCVDAHNSVYVMDSTSAIGIDTVSASITGTRQS